MTMKWATFFRGEKDVAGIVTFDLIGYFPPITLLFILQWHTEVYEKTLDISLGNRMIGNYIWHKYLEWYFKIVTRPFTSR